MPLISLILGFLAFCSVGMAEECYDCHIDKLDKPVIHPAAKEDCQTCHVNHDDPTTDPNRLVSNDINGLCFNCHDKKMGHPTNGRKDPLYPEKDFTCVSCHNPHSSYMPTLFRYNYGEDTPYKGHLCAVCHWDKYGYPKPPTPPWVP